MDKNDEGLKYFIENAIVSSNEMYQAIVDTITSRRQPDSKKAFYWEMAGMTFKKLESKNKKIVNHMAKNLR